MSNTFFLEGEKIFRGLLTPFAPLVTDLDASAEASTFKQELAQKLQPNCESDHRMQLTHSAGLSY